MSDWQKHLTDDEKSVLACWEIADDADEKDIFRFARSLAASRALVEKKDGHIRAASQEWHQALGHYGGWADCLSSEGCLPDKEALALTEETE